jgi:hypothetical protein
MKTDALIGSAATLLILKWQGLLALTWMQTFWWAGGVWLGWFVVSLLPYVGLFIASKIEK